MRKDLQPAQVRGGPLPDGTTVAVVIATFERAHFLADALDSVIAQTRPADEIIVVDDGSSDDPAEIVERYPDVRLLSFANVGPAEARNRGAKKASSDYIVFLDSDDILRPEAIAAGLSCMAANPGAGFVYGAYRFVDAALEHASEPNLVRVGARAYRDLLSANSVAMHGTVMYDRARFAEAGGFDATLPRCEDYELYLRMARKFRVASHPGLVADYRIHGGNLSTSVADMLYWAFKAHERNRPDPSDVAASAEWNAGHRFWKKAFAHHVWRNRPGLPLVQKWKQRWQMLRIAPHVTPAAILRQLVRSLLPERAVGGLRRARRWTLHPAVGQVDFGDLLRLQPISTGFGYKRGTPVDRFYIERFLERHAGDVRGRVLEAGDDAYSRRFGQAITRQDILNLRHEGSQTTIAGDLGEEDLLEPAAYDCIVLTQVLQLIFDVRSAIRRMHAALAPGGVVLATVPGITPVDPGPDGSQWFWSFTEASARNLFGDVFGPGNVEIACHGNAFAATCFLQGIALEDVGEDWIDHDDPAFPLIVTVRAQRAN